MNAEVAKHVESLPEGGQRSPGEEASPHPAVKQLFDLGPTIVKDVVDLLKPADVGGDTKARLGLHHLTSYACGQGDDKRQAFAKALAGTLTKDRSPDVLGFVIRQLQLCGGAEVVTALAPWLSDETLGEPACLALTAIRTGAAEPMEQALQTAQGRMRLVLLQNLGVLRDAKAAPVFRSKLNDKDVDLRLIAGWALANCGAAEDAERLLTLARREEGYAHGKAVDACYLLAKRLGEAGKTAESERLLKELRGPSAGG